MSLDLVVEKNKLQECFVSVVVVLSAADPDFTSHMQQLHRVLVANYSDFEIIVIKNIPRTLKADFNLNKLNELTGIRQIELARQVDNDIACGAGLENSIGDFTVIFNYKHDPVVSIASIVELCRQGSDVVVGVAKVPAEFGYSLMRPWVKFILESIGYSLPKNATDLRCLSRRAVNSITHLGESHRKLFVRIVNTGYPFTVFHYDILNAHEIKKTLLKGYKQAWQMVVFNSTKPLRWVSALGLFGSLGALCFALFSILVRLVKEEVIEGWTSTILIVSSNFFLMFIILALLGEYLARLLDEKEERRLYTVVSEKSSLILTDENRFNVLHDSIGKNFGENRE